MSEVSTPQDSITRIYSYKPNEKVLTLNNTDPFVNCLEQVHSFIDCCHDQFDPSRMSSFFQTNKSETESLRDLIWFFSFGNTNNNTEFYTNGHKFSKTNHIHKLAEALDRTPSNKFGFGIQLPGSLSRIDCTYTLPEMIELPWSARTDIVNPTFATYKYHNYTPINSASAGTELRKIIGSSNSAYILDCGKRLFHENYTTDPNNNIKGKGVSIFSGIIDSSTVNDPVLDIKNCPDAVKKLQFLIPFIDIPNVTTIFMYCTFHTEANTELFLAFLFGDQIDGIKTKNPTENIDFLSGSFPDQFIVVSGKDIPDLTSVTNYLAGPVQGCFRSLANTFLNFTNTNPCYKYEGITAALYAKLTYKTAPLDNIVNFNKIFQIRFKHIGDKTRLMDAVIINSLSEQFPICLIPLCHTGTIDTFSNRYALLGNLNTITPIKKSNLFINDNKKISKEQQDAIKVFKTQQNERCFAEQKALFEETIKEENIKKIEKIIIIIFEMKKYIELFKQNLVKRVKKISRLSCLTTDYWDVTVLGSKFIQNAYTGPDIQLVESMEIILDDIFASLNGILQDTKLTKMIDFFKSPNVPENYLLYDNELHVLLDALRLFDLFTVCGITVSADKKSLQTTKNIMSIATSIAKAGFSPRGTREKQEGGGYGIESTYIPDEQLLQIFTTHGITLSENKTFTIKEPEVLSKLRIYFIIETIKHKIYEHGDHEPNPKIKTLDALLLSIGTQSGMLEKTEIDEVISEIETIVTENSSYDTAEVIMELNKLQQLAIPYDDDADVIPNLSEMNLSANPTNRKGFKDDSKKTKLKRLGIQLIPEPTDRRSHKKHALPLVSQRLLKLKRNYDTNDDIQIPRKRINPEQRSLKYPVFGGRRTIRRAKRNKTRKKRKNKPEK